MSTDFLILGSTGMLGQAIMKVFRDKGKKVLGLSRRNAEICIDIQDDELLLKKLDELKPKYIINTIAIVNLEYCEQNPGHSYNVNSRVSAILSNYCANHKIKYIFISTDHYYNDQNQLKHTEEEPIYLINEYARSKYLGEILTLINKESLVIRTNIVGFRKQVSRPTFVEWVIKALKNAEKVTMFDDFYTSSIDVMSFSEALYQLIETGASGIYNLASSEVFSKAQFIKALAEKLNLDLKHARVGSVIDKQHNIKRNTCLGLDVSKVEKLLETTLPTLNEVVENLKNEYLVTN